MNRFQRKIETIGSSVYRTLFFPFKRRGIEKSTGSIILPKAYLYGITELKGRNYIGKRVELNHVIMGFGSYTNNDCMFTNTEIGKYTSIGTGVASVIGRHPTTECISTHPAFYSANAQMGFTYFDGMTNLDNKPDPDNETDLTNSPVPFEETVFLDKEKGIQIRIGNDVWIGNDVRIMEGVTIGDGAVVATGSIVTKDVEPYSIVAGIPAKVIRKRFSDDQIEKLLALKWWDKDEKWLKENAELFNRPNDFFASEFI